MIFPKGQSLHLKIGGVELILKYFVVMDDFHPFSMKSFIHICLNYLFFVTYYHICIGYIPIVAKVTLFK